MSRKDKIRVSIIGALFVALGVLMAAAGFAESHP